MLHPNFVYLLDNTPPDYPICLDEKEALKYLEVIDSEEFGYNNINAYDIIDYEKLIYIETMFPENEKIQTLLNEIKASIAYGYRIKNQYKNRIIDIPIYNDWKVEEERNEEGYCGIPRKNKKRTQV